MTKLLHIYACIMGLLLLLFLPTQSYANPESETVFSNDHPRILGDESQYAAWRAKANTSPWKEMKAKAQLDAVNHSYQFSTYWGGTNQGYQYYCFRLKDVLSACALSYVLNPNNNSFYVSKARDQLINGLQYLISNRPSSGWSANVAFGAAIFESILTLDIMYSDLSTTDISRIENMINSHINTIQDWDPSPAACRGLWAIYNNNTSQIIAEKNNYKNQILKQFSADGVFLAGGDYADARMLEGDRYHKHIFMDILEKQGYNEFYNHPKLVKGHEWIMGYGSTPSGRVFGFGDASLNRFVAKEPNDLGAYRVSSFSQTAQNYAKMKMETTIPRPNLLGYVLSEQQAFTQATPKMPTSRIFRDGGAWFYEDRQSSDILAGAIWNPKGEALHQHNEVNAIHLSGYNEVLLTNAGYNSWASGIGGFSWTYLHDRALSANTVLLNYPVTNPASASSINNHRRKTGAGIIEGFTSDYLDFACGDSGSALPNGKHLRNFVFVHPANGKEGYWVLFDEVTGNSSTSTAHIALHPFSNNVTTNTSNQNYTWRIREYGDQTVYLSIHLGTSPSRVQQLNGIAALGSGQSKNTRFLYNTYNLDADKKRNIVSVLQPHKSLNARPNWTRISGSGFAGTRSSLGNGIMDYAIGSEVSNSFRTYQNHGFTGESIVYRTINNATDWYFVKSGTRFNQTGTNLGFSANRAITISMKNREGQIYATSSTTVDLGFATTSNCYELRIDGIVTNYTQNANGTIRFTVSSGLHTIKVNTCSGGNNNSGGGVTTDPVEADAPIIDEPTTTTTTNTNNSNYCEAESLNAEYEHIQRVVFKTINNNSGNDSGYGNYTNISTNIRRNENVNITLTPAFAAVSFDEYWRVWIDYNRDGDFNDANELAFTAIGKTPQSGTIRVPSNATTGATRMRVAMQWNTYASPCGEISYGEIEDYTVVISNALGEDEPRFRQSSTSDNVVTNLIYPNPSSGVFYMDTADYLGQDLALIVYDILGQEVKNIIHENMDFEKMKIDLSTLDKGIYFIKIKNNTKLLKTQKVVIE